MCNGDTVPGKSTKLSGNNGNSIAAADIRTLLFW
jgi:hypothetical protein